MTSPFKRLTSLLPHAAPDLLATAAFAAWCAVCAVFACGEHAFVRSQYTAHIPLGVFLIAVLATALCLFVLGARRPRYLYRLAPVAVLAYGAVCAYRAASLYTALGFVIPVVILLVHSLRCDRAGLDDAPAPSARVAVAVVAVAAALMAAYLITAALMRHASYYTPCYDFGIFAQMFHNMRTLGIPLTTCERTVEMSHFAVHMSPFCYLLLPFYMLIPRPETLLVLQVLGVLSGVVPLWLLAHHHRLSPRVSAALCLLYIGCAALTGGIFYDFHENKFLTALLLWLFWALDRKKLPLVALFSVLTLSVKEDAALYVLFIGLWLLLTRPEKKTGGALMLGGGTYFVAVTSWINTHGDGVMFNRFDNIIGKDGGIAQLLRTALTNPALLLHECMADDKLLFTACILLSLGLLPLLTRRLSDLLLCAPFVIVHLISDYAYQHQLGFQYTYGTTALLFYLAVCSLAALPARREGGVPWRRLLLCLGLSATVLVGAVQLRNHRVVFENFRNNRADSAVITEVLRTIPDHASVRTSSMFASHLADRRELYYLTNEVEAEYVVLDLRPYINITSARGYEVEYFERQGYELLVEVEYVIAVLKKLPAPAIF